jgi:hypothetical protein
MTYATGCETLFATLAAENPLNDENICFLIDSFVNEKK